MNDRPSRQPAEDSNWLTFDEELGTLPDEPSFWLNDRYFWSGILKPRGAPPFDTAILVKPGWAGDIDYDMQANQITIPIGVACAFFDSYVEEMEVRPTAAQASQFRIFDIYCLYRLYDNWGIDKERWLFGVVLASAVKFKFNELIDFITTRLDRDDFFGGRFLDELNEWASSSKGIPAKRRARLLKAVKEDRIMESSRYTAEAIHVSIQQININGDVVNSNVVAARVIQSSSITVDKANISDELKVLLSQLHKSVAALTAELPEDEAALVAQDLAALTKEAISSSPRRAFWRRAADGLVALASTVATVGIPVVDLVNKIVAMLN